MFMPCNRWKAKSTYKAINSLEKRCAANQRYKAALKNAVISVMGNTANKFVNTLRLEIPPAQSQTPKIPFIRPEDPLHQTSCGSIPCSCKHYRLIAQIALASASFNFL